jgi:hypothetical protein
MRGGGGLGSEAIVVTIGVGLCLIELCPLSGQNGVRFIHLPPPKSLADLIKAMEPKYGPFLKRNAATAGEEGYDLDLDLRFGEDACAFMRAAILKDQDHPG